MSALWIALGAALIALGLRDAFSTLFQPMGHGQLGGFLARAVWRATRVGGPRALPYAGPAGMIVVILAWLLAVGGGWALILWTALPQDALLASGLDPADQDGFGDALYWSFTVLTTLGLGDITPLGQPLRIAVVTEAVMGFGLLTAGLTWLLSVVSGVGRARLTAAHAHALWLTGAEDDGADAAGAADALADDVREMRVTLRRTPRVFYFRGRAPEDSLPNALLYGSRLALAGSGPPFARLAHEVDQTAELLATPALLGGSPADTGDVLARFARAERWEPWRAPGRVAVGVPRAGEG